MAVVYKVRAISPYGTVLAIFDDFKSLEFSHEENAVGTFLAFFDGTDPRMALFTPDTIIEVWRSDKAKKIAWYQEFIGLVRGSELTTSDDGFSTYKVWGADFISLLNRRVIDYFRGTPQADKTGKGETVIKEFVNENAGALATVANGRLHDGVMPGVRIEIDRALGLLPWTGFGAYEVLLDIVQDVATATGLFFDFTVGLLNGVIDIEFKVMELMGDNRTAIGVDRNTGLNPYGNAPILFSLSNGNMGNPVFTIDRTGEGNACIVLGAGEGSERDYVEVKDESSIALSPYGRMEFTASSNTDSTLDLTSIGAVELDDKKAKVDFNFTVLQTDSSQYAKDYWFGDIVTAEYNGLKYDYRISSVKISISSNSASDKITIKTVQI